MISTHLLYKRERTCLPGARQDKHSDNLISCSTGQLLMQWQQTPTSSPRGTSRCDWMRFLDSVCYSAAFASFTSKGRVSNATGAPSSSGKQCLFSIYVHPFIFIAKARLLVRGRVAHTVCWVRCSLLSTNSAGALFASGTWSDIPHRCLSIYGHLFIFIGNHTRLLRPRHVKHEIPCVLCSLSSYWWIELLLGLQNPWVDVHWARNTVERGKPERWIKLYMLQTMIHVF
jgi:hypothetical protein